MSRTTRRRHGLGRHASRRYNNVHHGMDGRPYLYYNTAFGYELGNVYLDSDPEYFAFVRHLRKLHLHSDKYEPMNNPSWWNTLYTTRPERAEVRVLILKTLRCVDLEEAPIFPGKRQKEIYYW